MEKLGAFMKSLSQVKRAATIGSCDQTQRSVPLVVAEGENPSLKIKPLFICKDCCFNSESRIRTQIHCIFKRHIWTISKERDSQ